MTFIALLIVLVLMQYWGSASYLHRDEWYSDLLKRVMALSPSAELTLIVAVGGPAVLVSWFLAATEDWLFGLFGLGLNVVLLLYCLGRGDYSGLLQRYRDYCRDGNFESASLMALEAFPTEPGEEEPGDAEHLHRWMKQHLVYMGFERWFAVIFYFVLLGAGGALAYRLLHLAEELSDQAELHRVQRKLLHLVDWVPSRLLVFAFALTGDYMGSREQVAASIQSFSASAAEAISDAAHAALGLKSTVFSDNGDVEAFAQVSDWEVGQLQGLMSRSAVAWIIAISLLVVVL